MKFSPDKYKYYTNGSKVIAASTFAGRTVRGVASCSAEDEFSLEKGKALAAARCNLRVAEKRKKRAQERLEEAYAEYIAADKYLDKMAEYSGDADVAYYHAENELKKMLETL